MLRKPFLSIANNKKVKFDGTRCPFSTFLRLQCDHHCACAQKWCHFSFVSFFIFFKSFQTKKIKALRPKMTKIASRGGSSAYLTELLPSPSHNFGHTFRKELYPFPLDKKSSSLSSFLPRSIILWNSLLSELQKSSSLSTFKSALKSHLCT